MSMLSTKGSWQLIPPRLQGALARYVLDGVPPGGFLEAVISNNLAESMARGDAESRDALFAIVGWLYNEAPGGCWNRASDPVFSISAWGASEGFKAFRQIDAKRIERFRAEVGFR